jgi:hypothetical protein
MIKKTRLKVKSLIKKAEKPLLLYLATSQIHNCRSLLNELDCSRNSSGKVWSGILTTSQKILARFNNHQVVRPLEAKAYLVLRTIYWLIEQKHHKAILFTDNSAIQSRFQKLTKIPLAKGYSLEPEFRLTQRGKIPWPKYLWLAHKLIAEHYLNISLNYLNPLKNPATLLTKSLKVCAKCSRLKCISPGKRNCSSCQKASRIKQYERWLAWQQNPKNPKYA